MTALVDAAKGYAYLDRDRLVKIDIHDGLDATLALLRGRLEGVTVVRTYDRSAPMLAAHGTALNQVWSNLLDNAMDAIRGRGRIEIVTRREVGQVVIAFIDDGCGFPTEVRGRLFDPFFTTEEVGRGMGLGLTSARSIVVGHGGSITLDSQPGRTEVSVSLPLPVLARA